MGYKDENIKHRQGFFIPTAKYRCPHCGGDIKTKATFITCSTCKKVVDGDELISKNS